MAPPPRLAIGGFPQTRGGSPCHGRKVGGMTAKDSTASSPDTKAPACCSAARTAPTPQECEFCGSQVGRKPAAG